MDLPACEAPGRVKTIGNWNEKADN